MIIFFHIISYLHFLILIKNNTKNQKYIFFININKFAYYLFEHCNEIMEIIHAILILNKFLFLFIV